MVTVNPNDDAVELRLTLEFILKLTMASLLYLTPLNFLTGWCFIADLEKYNRDITDEIVMHLALDFGVSYKAILYRTEDKKIGLIEKSVFQKLSKEKPKQLLAKIGRSVPRLEKLSKFPHEYIEMVFDAYRSGYLSLSKLAELLEITLEEAKDELKARNIPINLGVNSELELLSDIENA